MTASEIEIIYDKIVNHVLELRIKQALDDLKFLVEQSGSGLSYDRLRVIKNNYYYMLKYRMDGFTDPNASAVRNEIQKDILAMVDDEYDNWNSHQKNPALFFFYRDQSITSETKKYIDFLSSTDDWDLIDLIQDQDLKENKKLEYNKTREEKLNELFVNTWTSKVWEDNDHTLYEDFFISDFVKDYEKSSIVSALFLSLLHRMDEEKILFLIDLCKDTAEESSQRALVALIIVLYIYDSKILLYKRLNEAIEAFFSSDRNKRNLYIIIIQLICAKYTSRIVNKMERDIIPEVSKIGSKIQDKIKSEDWDQILDESNPEWKNIIDDESISDKIKELNEMQKEGADVYMYTFQHQKHYSFFNFISNWFLPFYSGQSSVRKVMGDGNDGILKLLSKTDALCSSDKYSFYFNLMQLPEQFRKSAFSSLAEANDAMLEDLKDEMNISSDAVMKRKTNKYIQDLYRFFYLYNPVQFKNIFKNKFDFYNTSVLGKYINTKDRLMNMVDLYMKNEEYDMSVEVLDIILDNSGNNVSAGILQRKGFCLQKAGKLKEALDYYIKADLIKSEDIWTLKKIAYCYKHLSKPERAIQYFKKIVSIKEDLPSVMNIGHMYVSMGKFDKALNYYFRVELDFGESVKTDRAIAWCSFRSGKKEQAEKYFQKILSGKPGLNDFINYGHFVWSSGELMKAVNYYKRGINETKASVSDFMKIFDSDVRELVGKEIKEEDISIMRDAILYEIEDI